MTYAENTKQGRRKHLHIIFFIDSSQTRSVTLKLTSISVLVILFFTFFVTASVALVHDYKQRGVVSKQRELILRLKTDLFAEGISHHKILTQDYLRQSHEVVSNLDSVITLGDQLRKEKSLKTVKPIVEKSTVPKTLEKQPESAKPTIAPDVPKQIVMQAKAPRVEEALPPDAPISFENLSISEDEPGNTSIQFDLEIGKTHKKSVITGWVCAVAEVEGTTGDTFRTAPQSVSLNPGHTPLVKNCKGGEYVKFSRLRPTELAAAASKGSIQRIILFFSESRNGRLYSQSFSAKDIK